MSRSFPVGPRPTPGAYSKLAKKLKEVIGARLRRAYFFFADPPPPPLVSDDFLAIVESWNSPVASEIRQLMEWYPKLLRFKKWSHADIQIALELDYSLRNHVELSDCRWTWKYGAGADCFYGWVKHSYRQLKAEELGLSLEEFIALWRGFVGREPRIRQWDGKYRKLDARETLAYYLRARRHGLRDNEIRYTLFHELERFGPYVRLRKKFDRDFVQSLLNATWEDHGRLEEKYVVEALRLGATREAVLKSVKTGKIDELALTLRRASRTEEQ